MYAKVNAILVENCLGVHAHWIEVRHKRTLIQTEGLGFIIHELVIVLFGRENY